MMTVRSQLPSNKDLLHDPALGSWSPITCNNGPLDTVAAPGDLVSLAWLQKGDIIQIAPLDGEDDFHGDFCASTTKPPKNEDFLSSQSDNRREVLLGPPNHSLPTTTLHLSATPLTISITPSSTTYCPSQCGVTSPFSHTTALDQSGSGLAKPNYSYTHLIFMAIESTPQKCMTVNQIYNWCESNFPFYKHAGAGWKNSLRHNLSINKSFKRLPRDSRGPGRGAFWTVEPRERSALLDAIKRNPWNFANMAAIVSAHSDCSAYVSSSIPTSADLYLFDTRRFSLTQRAPDQLLRSEDMGRADLNRYNGLASSVTSHGFKLLSNTDGRLIATVGSASQPILKPDADSLDGEFGSPSSSRFTPCVVTKLSPEYRAPLNADPATEWPAEEEEKYLHSLRLLVETDNDSLRIHSGNRNNGIRLCEPVKNDSNGMSICSDLQTATRRRRKSRLQPTRFVDESPTFPTGSHVLGTCNECKENAASGCDSCHAQRLLFPETTFEESKLREHIIFDIANTLDSDQEHGPAGGPAARKHPVRSTGSSIANHFSDLVNDSTNSADSHRVEPVSQEVYVTPAPCIDHEYSHCQAQLRGPEDNCMVNRYNEEYCSRLVRQLTRSRGQTNRNIHFRPHSKAFHRPGNHRRDNEPDSEELDEVNDYDDPYSSHNQADVSDGSSSRPFGKRCVRKRIHLDNYSPVILNKRRGNRTRRGNPRYDFDCSVNSCDRLSTRVLITHRYAHLKSRRRRKTTYSRTDSFFSLKTRTRRSRRAIRAPRRPYDEFEVSFSVDEDDQSNFDESFWDRNARFQSQLHDETTIDDNGLSDTDSREPKRLYQRARRGRRRGRRRLTSESLHRHTSPRRDYDAQSGNSSGNDGRVYRLKATYKFQGVHRSRHDDVSSTSSVSSEASQTRQEAMDSPGKVDGSLHCFGNSFAVHPVPGYHRYSIGSVWGQSRMALARRSPVQHPSNYTTEAAYSEDDLIEEPALDPESPDQDFEECEEVDIIEEAEIGKVNEHTTVEAAQLLLGISQMQSFRLQSGYLSLDSSGTTESMTCEASTGIDRVASTPLDQPIPFVSSPCSVTDNPSSLSCTV